MPSQPKIAIVGGGPSGLALGLLLHRQSVPFTIFETQNQPTDKELAKPSGMLDLHPESGLEVIKQCGLYEEFMPLTGECSEDFVVADRDGTVLYNGGGDETRPEISRNNLNKLFMGHFPADNIKWGHKLLSATTSATSGHAETELDFGPHGKHTFDLVIGADGAWSKTRKLLTDLMPHYTGMQIITVTIREITKKYPHLAKLVGSGSFGAYGKKHGVISQRGPIDSARIFLWLTIPDQNFATSAGLLGKPASSAKDKLLTDDALLGTFGPIIKELVATACDEESVDNPDTNLDIRSLHTLPHGSAWEHKAGITLVGDAAHLMLPNGEGVNFAMFDSLLVSRAITKAYETAGTDARSFQIAFDPLAKEYEAALVERAKKTGKETDQLISKMFGTDDAAHDFVRFFKEMTQQHQPVEN